MTPVEWLMGGDTGTSSMTIMAVMTGTPMTGRPADVPHDPDDFGRCYRLIQHFPEWRARLPEVSAKYPAWGPMVREWDELTWLYEAEKDRRMPGRWREMYRKMCGLVDEGMLYDGWVRFRECSRNRENGGAA